MSHDCTIKKKGFTLFIYTKRATKHYFIILSILPNFVQTTDFVQDGQNWKVVHFVHSGQNQIHPGLFPSGQRCI